MASSYSIQKQGFKERMGRSHATLDEQFSASWANCQQLEELVDRMGRHMKAYVDGIKAMVVNGHAVSDDFKTFYERQPERLTSIAIKYELIQQGFRTDKLSLLERLVQQNVFLRMQEFKVELAGLRSKVGDREVARKRYDHYLSKINELREGRAKQNAKGKELSVGELDKLTRNEKKFEDARLEYVAINRLVTRSLWVTWSRRFQILDPIYAEILKIKANFTQALSNQLQTILPPLKAQMAIELKEEALPAVFAPQGQQQQQQQQAGGGRVGGTGLEEANDNHYDEYGVMSPGGSQQMDPRRLAAHMQAATEKLNVDAAVAQRKAAEKHARANNTNLNVNGKSGFGVIAVGGPPAARAAEQDSDEEDEAAAAAARRAAAAAKAKGKGGVAAAGAAPRAAAGGAVKKSPAQSPPPEADESGEEEEDGVDDDSDDDEEERQRKARKAAKKEKARAKERAAAAAAAAAGGAKPKKATAANSNSLDFLGDIMSSSSSAAPAAGRKGAPMDLLAFSPAKPVNSSNSDPMDLFATPAANSAPKQRGGKKLELNSFFSAAPAASAAAPTPGAAQVLSPGVVAANASPLDPFADLPHAESSGPVDLFAVPVQQSQPPPPQETSEPIYNPNFPGGVHPAHAHAAAGGAPGFGRAASVTPGAPLGGGGSLDDPFFSTPLPLPTSITPKGPVAAAGAGGAAKKPASKPAAAKKAASRSSVHDDSDSSSSSESDTSDSEQEEGRAPTRKPAGGAVAGKKPAGATANRAPATQAPGGSPINTDDPFDFTSNPTPSQREAAVAPAAGAGGAPAKKPAAAKQPPPAAAAAPTPSRPSVNASAASLPSLSDPSPHGPSVPAMPRGGLPDLHVAAAAAAAPAAASAGAGAGRPAVTPISASHSPGGPPNAAPVQTPEDYSPTRQDYDPFAGREQKPAADDPFAGVNEDW